MQLPPTEHLPELPVDEGGREEASAPSGRRIGDRPRPTSERVNRAGLDSLTVE